MNPLLDQIRYFSNEWLAKNTPLNTRFTVYDLTEHSGMVTIVIDSTAQKLGELCPSTLEANLQKVLEHEFPNVVFMLSGAQREHTKSKLRQDPARKQRE